MKFIYILSACYIVHYAYLKTMAILGTLVLNQTAQPGFLS